MAEFHVPMTLVVQAETAAEARLLAIGFERQREQFDKDGPYRWLHFGLAPAAEVFQVPGFPRGEELERVLDEVDLQAASE